MEMFLIVWLVTALAIAAVKRGKRSAVLSCVLVLGLAGTLAACDSTETATSKKPEVKSETVVKEKETEQKTQAGEENQEAEDAETSGQAAAPSEQSGAASEVSDNTNQIPVTLVQTIDGDTIKILYEGKEQNVRYLLIDTPETNHPRLGKQPFGEEAKARNKELVNSGKLTIEFDIGQRIDKYGRLLAYVYADGKSVQQTLLEEGLARVAYVYPPNTRHLTPYEEAQERARAKKIGIWSVEDYATDSGFNGSVPPSSGGSGNSSSAPAPEPKAPDQPAESEAEYFQNCTELRKVYPNGVPSTHPAYQAKMDRDKDNFACER